MSEKSGELKSEVQKEEIKGEKEEKEMKVEEEIGASLIPPPYERFAGADYLIKSIQSATKGDKIQATHLLIQAMRNIGIDPARDVENIASYINNIAQIASVIPDTPETQPIKSSILSSAARRAGSMLDYLHFRGEDEDFNKLMKIYERQLLVQAMRSVMSNNDNKSDKYLTRDELLKILEEREKRREEESKYSQLMNMLNDLSNKLSSLESRVSLRTLPSEGSEENKLTNTLNELKEAIMSKKEEALASTITSGLKDLKDVIEKKGLGGSDIATVVTAYKDLVSALKDAGLLPKEKEEDWKTVALGAFTDTISDFLDAYKEIVKGKTEKEVEEEIEKEWELIDQKVAWYIRKKYEEEGVSATINTREVALTLGLTEPQVLASIRRLQKKGVFQKVTWLPEKIEKVEKKEGEKVEGKEEKEGGEQESE